ncbi:MAG: Ku protein [Candidatus Nanoarchaeia archaeon]
MAKAIWKGFISFGLVTIPVKLISCAEPKQLTFHLYCSKHFQKLKYERYCSKGEHFVPWTDVIRGLELGTKKVFFEKEELKLPIREAKVIEILQFTEPLSIDPIFFEKNYYLLPEKGGERAYALLRECLSNKNLVGIGKVFLRDKDYLIVIRDYKGVLLLTTLYYEEEVRKPEFEELRGLPKLSEKEISLANKVLSALTKPFELSKYKSARKELLVELIKKKIKVPKITPTKDLMLALAQSIRGKK